MNFFKTKHYPWLIFTLAFLQWNCNPTKDNNQKSPSKKLTVIANVSVLTMTSDKVLEDQNVIIENGIIKYVGQSSTPPDAKYIDGRGKYLMPGLTEMHAHIPVAQDGNDSLVMETLFLYLSQGVTNIRGMLGNPYHLGLRQQAGDQTILSPRIYTSSPSLNGNSIPTKEEAISKITQYQKDGYDFLKIHPGIKLEVWEAVEEDRSKGWDSLCWTCSCGSWN